MSSVWQLAVSYQDQIEAIYHFCDTPPSTTTATPATPQSSSKVPMSPPPPPSASTSFSSTFRGGLAAFTKASSILGSKSILLLVLESHLCGPILRDRLWPYATDKARAFANSTFVPTISINEPRDNRSVSVYGNGKTIDFS